MDIDDLLLEDEESDSNSNKNNEEKEIENLGDSETQDTEIQEEDRSLRKIPIGKVEHFFSKISVLAIELTGDLKIGDTIEIEHEGELIKFKVSSMQIDNKDVQEASAGSSVGIKVDAPVKEGSKVYVIN